MTAKSEVARARAQGKAIGRALAGAKRAPFSTANRAAGAIPTALAKEADRRYTSASKGKLSRSAMTGALAFGKPYGGEARTKSGVRVHMYRNGRNRVRWYTYSGRQIGPEQSNVAPAIAYAVAHGWRV